MKKQFSNSTTALLMKEEREINRIEEDMDLLREKLLEKRPSHFSKRDIVNTFFGSLIIGLTFILKGAVVSTAENMDMKHVFFIVLSTVFILTIQIYYIGYSRVSKKEKLYRKFNQFWAKRITTLYGIALIVSTYLVYIFGTNEILSTDIAVFNAIILLSMPCAIGAAIPHLLKKY